MNLYGGLAKPVALIIVFLFSLYLGLYLALFGFLFALLQKLGRLPTILLTPCLWVAVELARARITGFPWDLLGNSQVDNLLLTRLAPLAGVMCLSFLVVAGNTFLVSPFLFPGKRAIPLALTAFLAVVLIETLGFPHPQAEPVNAPAFAVMMQENLSVGATARNDQPLNPAAELATFSQLSLDPGTNGSFVLPPATHPTLVIWPEAPSHLRSDDPFVRQQLGQLARNSGAGVIAGNLGVDFTSTVARGYFEYDSASLFDSTGNYRGRYDKIHLVPWGEYIPFKRFFAFAQKLTEGVGDMDPGHERTVFQTGGHTYGVFICYESIFGDEVRQFVKNGAEVLVNISDDGWYGDTGAPWQHLNMARMRAIENHRYLLRSTNTGVTTVIDPLGRIATEAPRHVRAAFAFPFGYESDLTFYTRFGDWFAYLCALATIVALALTRRRMN